MYLSPASRYSEDIDLLQIDAGPIGPMMTALREHLDPWLGESRRKQSEGRMTFICRFDSEIPPIMPLRLKIEVNTREHFAVMGYVRQTAAVDNPWFRGQAEVVTHLLEELLGTKLRAFYQRKQGRDLFDLSVALSRRRDLDCARVVDCFSGTWKRRATPCSGLSSKRISTASSPTQGRFWLQPAARRTRSTCPRQRAPC